MFGMNTGEKVDEICPMTRRDELLGRPRAGHVRWNSKGQVRQMKPLRSAPLCGEWSFQEELPVGSDAADNSIRAIK